MAEPWLAGLFICLTASRMIVADPASHGIALMSDQRLARHLAYPAAMPREKCRTVGPPA